MPYMYILECADGSYYTGSTWDLDKRLREHQRGDGANFTKKRLPVKLIYFEEYARVEDAFLREKQVQGWSRRKKEALMNGEKEMLIEYARNYTEYPASTLQSEVLSDAVESISKSLPEPVEGNDLDKEP